MKTKSAKGAASMNNGGGGDDAAAPSAAMADAGADSLALQMLNDTSVGLADPNDRGMPDASRRSPHGDMSPGRMDEGAGGPGDAMPGASMGGGGGNGDKGVGGGSGDGGGDFGASKPQVRRCGTMEVHRRLLSTVPEYGASATRSKTTRCATRRAKSPPSVPA